MCLKLKDVPILPVARSQSSFLGFAGIAGKAEMRFVKADARSNGLGRFLSEEVFRLGVTKVTVNEQNPASRAFHEKLGFITVARSDTDEEGGLYPILMMERR